MQIQAFQCILISLLETVCGSACVMTIIVQLILYCLLFTVMVILAVVGGAVNALYFCLKPVREVVSCCGI